MEPSSSAFDASLRGLLAIPRNFPIGDTSSTSDTMPLKSPFAAWRATATIVRAIAATDRTDTIAPMLLLGAEEVWDLAGVPDKQLSGVLQADC